MIHRFVRGAGDVSKHVLEVPVRMRSIRRLLACQGEAARRGAERLPPADAVAGRRSMAEICLAQKRNGHAPRRDKLYQAGPSFVA